MFTFSFASFIPSVISPEPSPPENACNISAASASTCKSNFSASSLISFFKSAVLIILLVVVSTLILLSTFETEWLRDEAIWESDVVLAGVIFEMSA